MFTVYYGLEGEAGARRADVKSEPYLEESEAHEWVRLREREMLKYYKPGELWHRVEARQVKSLPKQKVILAGALIGYQFNRESMGERKPVISVSNVTPAPGGWAGEALFLGRRIRVEYRYLNIWEGTELIGFTN